MTNEELQKQEPRSSTEIESDIHTTRGRMDATLDELGDRLTARSLLNSALDWWNHVAAAVGPAAQPKTRIKASLAMCEKTPFHRCSSERDWFG